MGTPFLFKNLSPYMINNQSVKFVKNLIVGSISEEKCYSDVDAKALALSIHRLSCILPNKFGGRD